MEIELNHTIVPSATGSPRPPSTRASGIPRRGRCAFRRRQVNALTLVSTTENFEALHYAFKVSDDVFDRVFAKLRDEGIPYGSGPWSLTTADQPARRRTRLYFRDPSGHILELLTAE